VGLLVGRNAAQCKEVYKRAGKYAQQVVKEITNEKKQRPRYQPLDRSTAGSGVHAGTGSFLHKVFYGWLLGV
jgi:hypothetical protein